MAYLTEHLSRQETGIVSNRSANTAEPVSQLDQRAQDGVENTNFQIARNLKTHKTCLIDTLAQFPMTALWLLNEHEKTVSVTEQDEDVSLSSDLATALGEIKKHYLSASQSLSVYGRNHATHHADRQQLVSALQRYPYSFNDLVKIVDVIVYVWKARGLAGSRENHAAAPSQSASRHSRVNEIKLAESLKAVGVYGQDEAFLFLSRSAMHSYVMELLAAEALWLNVRQELANANTKLVLFIANQYKTGFLDFDDLVQEGQTGLLKAVDKFDYRLGFQFSTYAGYWIRQAISRSLSRCDRLVRVPCGQVANINKVFRAKNEIIALTGQEPSVQQLADFTKLSNDEINTILTISQTAISLESPDDDEEAFAPIDFLEQQVFSHPFNALAETDLEQLLSKAIETLNPREAKVICAHFGVEADREMTLQEIGAELNLTRERVRQIQVVALNKIKLNFGQQLACFL